jgi:hypothetical protein
MLHTNKISMHFLMSGIRGLNLDWSCVITSSISVTCFIAFLVFMIRTMAAYTFKRRWSVTTISLCMVKKAKLCCEIQTCISNLRSSSIVLCVSSDSTFCSVFICMFRFILIFLLVEVVRILFSSFTPANWHLLSTTHLLKSVFKLYLDPLSPTLVPLDKSKILAFTRMLSAGIIASGARLVTSLSSSKV